MAKKAVDKRLDWVSEHDERSREYNIQDVLISGVTPFRQMWDEGTVLDQGQEGACVGFGWTGEHLAQPEAPKTQPAQKDGNLFALGVYNNAKKVDTVPGEDYSGTSVLAGAKVMQSLGLIKSYRWAFDIQSVRDAVMQEGPVVIGIPWKDGMYSTDSNGIVKVTGKQVGGHCILLTGYDPAYKIGNKTYEVFRWRNSWGSGYGLNGSAYIKVSDLEKLLVGVGEACVPMGRTANVEILPNGMIKVKKMSFWSRVLTWFRK